jgi:hypothetical protein
VKNVLDFFRLSLEAGLHGRDFSTLVRERLIVDLRNELRRIGYQHVPQIGDFERLRVNMPQGKALTLKQFARWLQDAHHRLPADLPDRIAKRNRVLIFAPTLLKNRDKERAMLLARIKLKGGDPYTQQPLVFDYLFCRTGRTPTERDTTLVIDLRLLRFSDFAEYIHNVWRNSPLQYTDFDDIQDDIPRYTLHLTSGISQVVKNFVRLYSFAADIIVFSDGIIYF